MVKLPLTSPGLCRMQQILVCLLLLVVGFSSGCQSEPVLGTAASPVVLTPLEVYRNFLAPADFTSSRGFPEQLMYISAIATRANDIYVLDRGQGKILHINRAARTIRKFAEFQAGNSSGLFLAPDLSLYAVDRSRRRIVKFHQDGSVDNSFSGTGRVGAPVDITGVDGGFRIAVADQTSPRIAVLDPFGNPQPLAPDRMGSRESIGDVIALASSGNRLYALDRSVPELRITDLEGRQLPGPDLGEIKSPVSMAMDQCGHIFIADQFDNSIYIFDAYELVQSIPAQGSVLHGIQMISDIWIDGNLLYVADGPTATIQVLYMSQPCTG